MTIQRRGNEIIIRIPDNVDINSLQRLVNYLTYSELTKDSEATQEDVDNLSSMINRNWWKANKDRFLKQ